ncbi:hypothetical protein [Hungatella hathewayi]|uniref:hypothetical protein n=1 Tax=Hungatella hathewayi TaxID=154046 RepID=UPI00356677E4
MSLKNNDNAADSKHKTIFSAEIMYGDADFFDNISYITEDENEIKFITCFFECYTDALFEFYRRPDMIKYNTFCDDRDRLLNILNQFGSLAIPLEDKHGYKIELVKEYDDIIRMHRLLSDCLNAIQCLCNWNLEYMDEPGSIENYSIKDISGLKVLTRQEAMDLFKKMGMEVFIID